VAGVRTCKGLIQARLGVVVAAGAWSGGWLARALGDAAWEEAVTPRRGHLLELDPPEGVAQLTRGVMEVEYSQHYQEGGSNSIMRSETDVTFTATRSAAGKLLLGSSRESASWNDDEAPEVTRRVLERAAMFLPGLDPDPRAHPSLSVRVGLRPQATRGLPLIGPVQDTRGLWVAAGHEGSGLTLGAATGELIRWHVIGHDGMNEGDMRWVPQSLRTSELHPSPTGL